MCADWGGDGDPEGSGVGVCGGFEKKGYGRDRSEGKEPGLGRGQRHLSDGPGARLGGGLFPRAGADAPDSQGENDLRVPVPDGEGCDEELYRNAGPAWDPALASDEEMDPAATGSEELLAGKAVARPVALLRLLGQCWDV